MKLLKLAENKELELLSWDWPRNSSSISLYDKYRKHAYTLSVEDEVWTVFVQGGKCTARFNLGDVGRLQRALVIHTQDGNSPSAVDKFARNIRVHWGRCLRYLILSPDDIEDSWTHTEVGGIEGARVVKALLKVACQRSLGPWRPIHLPMVSKLNSFGGKAMAAQRNSRKTRSKVLPADVLSDMVRVLDFSSGQKLDGREREGAAALALMLQHGMRPVQLLAMDVEHVRSSDQSGTCVVSYHSAKRGKKGHRQELVRDVLPEWARLVVSQRDVREAAGEVRLFESTNDEVLWNSVKAACRFASAKVAFTPYWLRHTAAQGLADAGHSRTSIKNFLGHLRESSADSYHRGSRQQASFINQALGVSPLYQAVVKCAKGDFATLAEIAAAPEEHQIGGVVGARLIAGIGLCRSGQKSCTFDPVVSCYGCHRHIPALDEAVHMEAIGGMRAEVLLHASVTDCMGDGVQAPLQLKNAIAKAQKTLADVRATLGRSE